MFDVLIVDDEYEDRDILKLEIEQALVDNEHNIRFFEASSIKKAQQILNLRHFNLLTLDIQFDRLNEGLDALPEFFENYPTLNIIVVSGKLNKAEVTDRLFQFTKNNVLKGKRWARHFDVLDKKDDKKEAIKWAYHFSIKQEQGGDRIRELFCWQNPTLKRIWLISALKYTKNCSSWYRVSMSRERTYKFSRVSSPWAMPLNI